jgi:septum formation protein
MNIVLASTSPRRIELLTQAGLLPRVIAPDADETMRPRESPRAMVARLAREKAEAVVGPILAGSVSGLLESETLIIAADTTVVAPNGKTILGKPRDEAEARKMLSLLAGNQHTVLTGYCILKIQPPAGAKRSGKKGKPVFTSARPYRSHLLVRVVTSKVRMRALTREAIARYVKTGEPMDKAGSYAAQGIGMTLIESIVGSYSNVVGLPICQVMLDLEEKFGLKLFGTRGK